MNKNLKNLAAAVAFSLSFNTISQAQLSSAIIGYPLAGSPSPLNPIPFIVTASDIFASGWTSSFALTPLGALGSSNVPSPAPVFGVNMISFTLTPHCPVCILDELIFRLQVSPAIPGNFSFRVFNGATPISPIYTNSIPFAGIVNASITPQVLTGPTTINIAFSHQTEPGFAFPIDFLVRNMALRILYDPDCIPEPGVGKLAGATVALGFALLIWRRRRRLPKESRLTSQRCAQKALDDAR